MSHLTLGQRDALLEAAAGRLWSGTNAYWLLDNTDAEPPVKVSDRVVRSLFARGLIERKRSTVTFLGQVQLVPTAAGQVAVDVELARQERRRERAARHA